jgi:uncharacterized protein YdeI (YjbR/CyaY-like superfamily)
MKRKIHPRSRKAWRAWLQKYHSSAVEVWLVYFKKQTGKQTVTYKDSVEEALCFGWIDGIKRAIDDERYAHRFTPRKTGSRWSPLNISLAEKMIQEGKMEPAGLTAFEQRVAYGEAVLKRIRSKNIPLSAECEKRIRSNKLAWKNFVGLAPGYRKQYVGWLMNAKKPKTREKRLRDAVRMLEKNEKLGMK